MKLQSIWSSNSIALVAPIEEKSQPVFSFNFSFNGAIQFRIELFSFLHSDMHERPI